MTLNPLLPHLLLEWAKFGGRDLHVMLLSVCDFRENCLEEGRTFLMGVSSDYKG
jgi:hypothetical protein